MRFVVVVDEQNIHVYNFFYSIYFIILFYAELTVKWKRKYSPIFKHLLWQTTCSVYVDDDDDDDIECVLGSQKSHKEIVLIIKVMSNCLFVYICVFFQRILKENMRTWVTVSPLMSVRLSVCLCVPALVQEISSR